MRLSRQGGRWRFAWWLAAVLLTFHTLIAYGLPPSVPIAGTLLLGVACLFIGALNGLMIAVSLALATLAYAGALVIVDWPQAVYYRPLEQLASFDYRHGHRIYRPYSRLQMRVPHGDLQSMSPVDLAQPHEVLVETDGRGFRNGRDYAGEPWLLLGDSFVAGVNNTQSSLPGARLAELGIAAHHLAFPGDVDDYHAYLQGFRADHGDDARVALFLFEGNDFPARGEYEPRRADPLLRQVYKRWFGLFSETGVYRFTSSVYKRWRNRRKTDAGAQVLVLDVAGRPTGFYRPYVDASRADTYAADDAFEQRLRQLLAEVDAVFFIPTKYRAHHRLLAAGEPLPSARWGYLAGLCAEARVKCEDLTPTLARAAEAAEIWWRDDTHWNHDGIAAAAEQVAAVLAGRP